MQISARGDYAVPAALSLAAAYPSLMSAHAIAEDQDMPRKFLEAISALSITDQGRPAVSTGEFDQQAFWAPSGQDGRP